MIQWVAEIGSNHNRSLSRTLSLIDKAAEIGCNGVKFQLFNARLLYAPEFKDRIASMEKWALPERFLPSIKAHCNKKRIKIGISVFDLRSVEIAKEYADWLKIGSYEILWFPLLKAVIDTGLPWVFSTGMTNDMNGIGWLISMGLYKGNPPYAILHCNSNYPALPKHCNLSRIKEIEKSTRILEKQRPEQNYVPAKIGWSDHTRNPELVLTAIEQGASIVEFHFDLEDGKGAESSYNHCWKPSEAKFLIERSVFFERIEMEYPDKEQWIHSASTKENEASKWRTDPEDGLRPLQKYRSELLKK